MPVRPRVPRKRNQWICLGPKLRYIGRPLRQYRVIPPQSQCTKLQRPPPHHRVTLRKLQCPLHCGCTCRPASRWRHRLHRPGTKYPCMLDATFLSLLWMTIVPRRPALWAPMAVICPSSRGPIFLVVAIDWILPPPPPLKVGAFHPPKHQKVHLLMGNRMRTWPHSCMRPLRRCRRAGLQGPFPVGQKGPCMGKFLSYHQKERNPNRRVKSMSRATGNIRFRENGQMGNRHVNSLGKWKM